MSTPCSHCFFRGKARNRYLSSIGRSPARPREKSRVLFYQFNHASRPEVVLVEVNVGSQLARENDDDDRAPPKWNVLVRSYASQRG